MTVYVDGFNLYYGLKSKNWRRYYWLDVRNFAENLLNVHQKLVAVRYFTARIRARAGDPDKPKRQATFLEALETRPDLHIHYGLYVSRTRRCHRCGLEWEVQEEKMTDVNIAVALLDDAQDDRFDTAIVVSADSDLTGTVRSIIARYPNKRIVVAFPPDRRSEALRQVATASFSVGRKKLRTVNLRMKSSRRTVTSCVARRRGTDGQVSSKPVQRGELACARS